MGNHTPLAIGEIRNDGHDQLAGKLCLVHISQEFRTYRLAGIAEADGDGSLYWDVCGIEQELDINDYPYYQILS